MQLVTQLLRNRSGAAAVEMALITPMLIILMFGSFELGNYFWNEHKVVKAVRDGARFAGRQPFSNYICTSSTVTDTALTNTDLTRRIKNVTRTGVLADGGTARVYGWDNNEVTVTFSCPATAVQTGIYDGLPNAPRVKVAATVPYTGLFGALGFDTSGLNVVAEAQATVMGI